MAYKRSTLRLSVQLVTKFCLIFNLILSSGDSSDSLFVIPLLSCNIFTSSMNEPNFMLF